MLARLSRCDISHIVCVMLICLMLLYNCSV